MSNSYNNEHSCGCSHSTAPSVCQTLDELDFERGIWSAALYGDLKDVEQHLMNGFHVDCIDSSGYTALHYASRNGHFEVCETLIKSRCNVNILTRSGGASALHRAAYSGHKNIVRLLLSNKCNPSVQDSDGKTSLHKAAEKGNFEICEMILGKNPDLILVKDKRQQIPYDCVPVSNSQLQQYLKKP